MQTESNCVRWKQTGPKEKVRVFELQLPRRGIDPLHYR